jgi:hypothetical protein
MNLSSVGADIERLLKTARTVADSAALVNDMSTDIRTISYLLHPPLLDEAGLSSALRWYTEGFSERSGIEVHLDFPDSFAVSHAIWKLPSSASCQECLTNIHRHSESLVAPDFVSFRRPPSFAWKWKMGLRHTGRKNAQEILSSGCKVWACGACAKESDN